ncbi:hypothetical protein RHGRI_029069 [Rhododendron griersonianum]|uniref:Protein kinase domain-containing protein n=1 Tax=Rhododendron griersonianum TaxID=479676 RepID=A0AAV6IL61_9ERIC|nr:hypothetical protein RHGRI_029069 [Rhododendron griersonianum]
MYGSNWAQPIGAVTHEALKMENLLASIPTDRKTSHEDKLKSIMDEVKDCVENLHHTRDDTGKMKSISFHPMQINQGQPSNKAWRGGLLKEWLKFESSVVEDVQLSTSGSDSARRLTSNGRKVLRGILKRVEELHDSGCIHGDINTDTIIVSPHLDVLLLPPKLVKNQSPTEDLHNLHLVVEAMMYQRQSPLDVIHLKELLKRSTTELGAAFSRRRHLAFNHPCIWEVDETVQIILAIGCDYKSSSKAKFAQSAKNIPNSVTAGWVETIKCDNFYARLYQEWVNDMAKNKNEYFDGYDNREDGVRMPLFMRNCLQHPTKKKVRSRREKGFVQLKDKGHTEEGCFGKRREDVYGCDFPGIVLVLHSTATNKCQVYAIDTSQPRLPIKFLVDFQYPIQWGLGFVASKSTLYAVRGELECNDKGLGKFPTDFQSCDLKDWRKDSFRWESGLEFSGRKPSPVLVPLDGNIYALARGTCHLTQSGWEADPQKNPFEVFRPGCGWEPLLDPPFAELYSKSCHPFFEISTVIDKKNYVGFEALRKEGHDPKRRSFTLLTWPVCPVRSTVGSIFLLRTCLAT